LSILGKSGVHPPSFRKCNINIAGMQVGRVQPGDHAIMVLNVDSEVPQEVMEEIRGMPGIFTATFAKISSEKI
jgi:D-3-phosphoglycerate dehydrogenase